MNESNIKRPIGISLLAGLHVIGSTIVTVIILLYMPKLQDRPELHTVIELLGIPPTILFITIGLLLALGFLSGIGMWTGKKWGWFIGSFYYAYFIITNINTIIMIPTILESFGGETTRGPSYYYVKYGLRLCIRILIYIYFFRANVLTYFGLSGIKKWKPVLVQFGICLSLAILLSIVTHDETYSVGDNSQISMIEMEMDKQYTGDPNARAALISNVKAQPEAASIIPKSGTIEDFIADTNKPTEPSPVVSLEDFFEGNRDLGSIGCNLTDHPGISKFYEVLKGIRSKDNVQDVLVEIYSIDDRHGMWPNSEIVYIITSANQTDVEKWMKPLKPDEIFEGWSSKKPPSAAPKLKDGMNVYAAWWD